MARKLSAEAIEKISRRPDIKDLIIEEMSLNPQIGRRTINRQIRLNKPNSFLTTDAVVAIISKHTLLTRRQVLEDCPPKPRTNGSTNRQRASEHLPVGS